MNILKGKLLLTFTYQLNKKKRQNYQIGNPSRFVKLIQFRTTESYIIALLSGLEDIEAIFQASFNGLVLITGSKYGIEDSILFIILLLVVCAVFFRLSIKKNKIVKSRLQEGIAVKNK